jgi:hypothetical protein
MDDITNERFRKLEALIKEEGRRVADEVEKRLTSRLDNVAKGLEETITAAINIGFTAASEERKILHGLQVRSFQSVINRAEEIGASNEKDRKIGEVEAMLTALRSRVTALELACKKR